MAIEIHELTCINCPIGCQLAVRVEDGVVALVAGNACPRGDAYGRAEVTNPVRTVTTTVPVFGSMLARALPIKTTRPVPKASVAEVMAALAHVRVSAPIAIGDVVVRNVANTNVDMVATRSL